MDAPSRHLRQRLLEWRLCTPRDLRRCRRRVRRLARDLPGFETVWLDALVQMRKLTAFQARLLDSADADRLRIGPCILIDQLGRGLAAETFLARQRDGQARCVVKVVHPTPFMDHHTEQRLQKLCRDGREVRSPHIVVPHACHRSAEKLVLVSRPVAGPHLEELAIRRGRFAPEVVREIGRQLLSGLAELESAGIVHGDIRPRNARIARDGTVVLVDAGVAVARAPELVISAGIPPERYDGTAPELIETGRGPHTGSDLYALGCLLWQLLTGRPPFPSGDPLAKLAAHRTREVVDVREWAPDTPTDLAREIAALTAFRETDRPSSAAEALRRWGAPGRLGRRRLAGFRGSFNEPLRTYSAGRRVRTAGKALAAGLLLAIGTTTVSLCFPGSRPQVLQIATSVQRVLESTSRALDWRFASGAATSPEADGASPQAEDTTRGSLTPLPAPDAQGRIVLSENGVYAAGRVAVPGTLRIQAAPGTRATILVDTVPLQLAADRVVLENLIVEKRSSAPIERHKDARAAALADLVAQDVSLVGCTFRGPGFSTTNPGEEESTTVEDESRPSLCGIRWKLIDPADRSGGTFSARDVQTSVPGASLFCLEAPRRIEFVNTLVLKGTALIRIQPARQPAEIPVRLDRVTLRRTTAVLEGKAAASDRGAFACALRVRATDCVFDVVEALCRWENDRRHPVWLEHFELTGAGSIVVPTAAPVMLYNPQTGRLTPATPARLRIEGLWSGPFAFTGPLDLDARHSVIRESAAPRLRPAGPGELDVPGIDARRLRRDHSRTAPAVAGDDAISTPDSPPHDALPGARL